MPKKSLGIDIIQQLATSINNGTKGLRPGDEFLEQKIQTLREHTKELDRALDVLYWSIQEPDNAG